MATTTQLLSIPPSSTIPAPTNGAKTFSASEYSPAALEKKAGEAKSSPYMVVIVTVILSIIVVILIYATTYKNFGTGGVLSGIGALANANGGWFMLGIFLFVVGMATPIALCLSGAMAKIGVGVIVTLLLSVLSYLIIRGGIDASKGIFWIATILDILIGIVVGAYGTYATYAKRRMVMSNPDSTKADKDEAGTNFMLSVVMAVLGVIGLIILVVGVFEIWSNVTFS